MRIRIAFHVAGLVTLIVAFAMLAPFAASLYYNDGDAAAFGYAILITAGSGAALFALFRGPMLEVNHREGFVIVAFAWLAAGFFSSVPYLLSGSFPSPVDAVFEAVSGITTTGASVIRDIESMPHGILFWRSMTHWMGGMGIVLVGVAILPFLGIGGMQLFKAETSTISGDKFVPRIRDMARILFTIYILFMATMMALLMAAGMDLFDAFVHTVGGVATAGFSDKNLSVGHYGSFAIEAIVMTFMVLGATNFALHYEFSKKGFSAYLGSEEFRFYIYVMVVFTALIAMSLGGVYDGVAETLRYASFQVVSITTTTGYTTADFSKWPETSQVLLLFLMFIGGSVGSTTGSIKCIRILLLLKVCYKEIYRLIHPHAVIPVKLAGRVIDPDVIRSVTGYTVLFVLLFVLSAMALSATGLDAWTAVTSAAATIGNVGPAMGSVGPAAGYGGAPDAAKCIYIANMLLGRLEIYTLLILLVPAFWRG